MYYHDWILLELAKERERDLVRKLEHDQLIREAELINQQHGHKYYHMLDWLGRQLVHWGERLQARHALYHRQVLTHTIGGKS
jgi:hypothetical protein